MAGVLLKVICQHQGALDYDNLVDIGSGLDLNDTLDTLLENNELFSIHMVNGVKRVVAKTRVRRCKAQECPGCEDLHVCKFYLLGKCVNGRGRRVCRFGHNLHSEHNSGVLREHQLYTLSREDLCQLLLQNDNSFLPPVCNLYNRGPGPYGHCPDQERCRRLHVCERYIRGACAAGAGCIRSHDLFEPHPLRTLQQRGVPDSLVPSLLRTYQNLQALRSQQDSAYKSSGKPPSSQRRETGVKDEICMFFVKGDCKQGDRCWRAHCKLPYRWEVKVGESWTVLPDNEAIERDFCDPSNTHSSHSEAAGCVRFDSMTLGLSEVRRLSTLSSVVQPAYVLTTQWLWYWRDEDGRWVQYASAKEMLRMSSITSEALESRYQEDDRAVVEFSAGQQAYELSFPDMTQRSVRWSTARMVRRRPVFVSSSDAQAARSRSNGPRNVRTFKAVPGFWDKSAIPDIGYKAVPLPSSERDYQKVQELFAKTMGNFRISSIERVQNRDLWEVFQWKRELMKKNNGGRYSRELLLFHGTDPEHLDAICRDNFDWRLCGTNGTVYGEGSYFARDAKYSHSYTGRLEGGRSMFACRVLVGDYTRGSPALRRPPPKAEGALALYDSCVDDPCDPSIYVVFEKHQVYPEFLITYDDGAAPLRPVAAPPRGAPSLPVPPASSNPSAGLIPAPAGTKQRSVKFKSAPPLSSGPKAPAPTPPLGLAYVSPSKPATVRTQLKRPTLSSSRDSLSSAATTTSTATAKNPSHAFSTPASTSSHALSTPASTSSHALSTASTSSHALSTASTSSHAFSTASTSSRALSTASTSSHAFSTASTSSRALSTASTSSNALSTPAKTPSHALSTPAKTPSHALSTPAKNPSHALSTPAKTPSRALSTPAKTPFHAFSTPASTSSHAFSTPAKTPFHAFSTPASTSSHALSTPTKNPFHALSTPASTSSHDLILFDDNFDPLTPSTPASTYSFRLLTPASTSSLNAHTSSSSLAIQASTSSLTTQTSTSSITAHASTSSHTLISPASTSSLRLITPASTSSPTLITPASTSSPTLITPASTSSPSLITPASTSSPTLITPASTSSPTLITPASTSSHTSHPTVSHPLAHSSTPATPQHRVSRNPFSTPSPTHHPAPSLFPVFSPSTGAQFRPLSSPASSIRLKYEGPTSQPATRKTKEKDKCILQ